MKELQLREAKATLSAVVEAAENGEPTMITKHGRPAAVIISYAEWTQLKSKVPSFADILLAIPPLDAIVREGREGHTIFKKGLVFITHRRFEMQQRNIVVPT